MAKGREKEKKRLIVTCGGTGGHVFPGLAVANELRGRGHEVEVWLSGRAVEGKTLTAWNGPVFHTYAKPLSLHNLFPVIRSFFRCLLRFRAFKPDAVLAMGSYASLPPVLAAHWKGIRIVLHEANAVPGKAVEFLARYASCVAISFPETAKHLKKREVKCTGLPVRCDLEGQPRYEEIPEGAFVFFVTGGSQGAHRLNEIASQAAVLLDKEVHGRLFVLHQTGEADEEWVRACYEKAGVPNKTAAFFPDMGRAFASTDLVVARAGASTCFELAYLGKPALLVPLPSAVRDHQHLNAAALAASGGADEARQDELTGRSLMRYLKHKMENPMQLRQMATAIRTLAVPEAASRVADLLDR
ncbi:MAG: UDP-N-acetylglucosamine--N-acetylmuramyl-(pentapeptide) pyrophosphoryl-undecaprenol N-acetylglucosamine transferase [Kiritimatiellae bacterium]|nr:UDP-N-acetylglucosamine--N-acetylmuramyl-(pentapeptide) pyrophosphoryl-undecaprenol N-acetylglucosamine transferase [Kiritimatiellia bacterium]